MIYVDCHALYVLYKINDIENKYFRHEVKTNRYIFRIMQIILYIKYKYHIKCFFNKNPTIDTSRLIIY